MFIVHSELLFSNNRSWRLKGHRKTPQKIDYLIIMLFLFVALVFLQLIMGQSSLSLFRNRSNGSSPRVLDQNVKNK